MDTFNLIINRKRSTADVGSTASNPTEVINVNLLFRWEPTKDYSILSAFVELHHSSVLIHPVPLISSVLILIVSLSTHDLVACHGFRSSRPALSISGPLLSIPIPVLSHGGVFRLVSSQLCAILTHGTGSERRLLATADEIWPRPSVRASLLWSFI